jgi:hypothetical protein
VVTEKEKELQTLKERFLKIRERSDKDFYLFYAAVNLLKLVEAVEKEGNDLTGLRRL